MSADSIRDCRWCGRATTTSSRQCNHCGRAVSRRSRRDHDIPIPCPRCKVPAVFVTLGTLTIDICERCAGVWFDNGELDALPEQLSEKECANEAVSALTALRSPRSAIWNQAQYFDCPVCGDTMNRRNYETVSGIILNRCSTDGTWLDYANAVALFKLIADGRLQEIRDRAQIAIADQTRRHAVVEAARLKAQWQGPRDPDADVPVKVIAVRSIVWALLDFFS